MSNAITAMQGLTTDEAPTKGFTLNALERARIGGSPQRISGCIPRMRVHPKMRCLVDVHRSDWIPLTSTTARRPTLGRP